MLYLLDTNAISDLMRGNPRIERWLESLPSQDRVITCTVVRGEILFGISRLPAGRRRAELEATASQFLDALYCAPIPSSAADHYAVIKLARQQAGLSLDENDLWLAATAMALQATLISRDTDFGRIENLPVISPG